MTALNEWLIKAKKNESITSLDYHLALFFVKFYKTDRLVSSERFMFLVLWLNMELRSGHVCINVQQLQSSLFYTRFTKEETDELLTILNYPTVEDWDELLLNIDSQLVSKGDGIAPFIYRNQRLYFQRLWKYEQNVAQYLKNQSSALIELNSKNNVRVILDQLFPSAHSEDEIDWQKVAVTTALLYQVAIISGGPGTGKTTTVSKILAGLLMLNPKQNEPLSIMAAAPTGKAAARLTESLNQAISSLAIPDEIKSQLTIQGITLHRLIGARQNSQRYYYHENNKLKVDILLIDEASMIDLSLMSHIVDALPLKARLILLGDKEQLSSVEAGSVFGEICRLSECGFSEHHLSIMESLTQYHFKDQVAVSEQTLSMADKIALLHKSFRFNADSGIGVLANLVKSGNNKKALELLNNQSYQDITYRMFHNNAEQIVSFYPEMIDELTAHYLPYFAEIKLNNSPEIIIKAFNQFRVLAAIRQSDYGVNGLNRQIEKKLIELGKIPSSEWYEGKPIMINRNQPSLNLFNGDIGLTLKNQEGQLRVYFLMSDGSINSFSPYILPENELSYVMTIHKSQGSEFDHVAIVLPEESNHLLSRSLLYTAITRAKKQVTLYGSQNIVNETILNVTQRQSGLYEQLLS